MDLEDLNFKIKFTHIIQFSMEAYIASNVNVEEVGVLIEAV